MKTIMLSIVFALGLFSTAFAQKQNLKLVDDIGQVLADDDYLKPSKVLPIIFAKLEKKYPLIKRNKQVDQTISELIKLRRQYKAYGDTKAMMYRAYDHAIARALSPSNGPQTNSQGCQEAEEELARAMGRYDRALKSYSKCVNGTSFSLNAGIPMVDGLWGSPPSSNIESASGGGCQSQLRELKKASNWLSRMINNRNLACSFG